MHELQHLLHLVRQLLAAPCCPACRAALRSALADVLEPGGPPAPGVALEPPACPRRAPAVELAAGGVPPGPELGGGAPGAWRAVLVAGWEGESGELRDRIRT